MTYWEIQIFNDKQKWGSTESKTRNYRGNLCNSTQEYEFLRSTMESNDNYLPLWYFRQVCASLISTSIDTEIVPKFLSSMELFPKVKNHGQCCSLFSEQKWSILISTNSKFDWCEAKSQSMIVQLNELAMQLFSLCLSIGREVDG